MLRLRLNVYHYMIGFLLLLAAANIFYFKDYARILPLAATVSTAALLDIVLNYVKTKKKIVPLTAVISGIIISLVLTLDIALSIFAAAMAILSKHLIRLQKRHIFNPANLAILITLLAFPAASQTWWGAALLPLLLLNLLSVYKVRGYQALSFLFAVAGFTALTKGIESGANVFMNGTLLFFAFVMLVEPMTSPARRNGKVVYGMLAAALYVALNAYAQEYAVVGALALGNLMVLLINWKVKS